MTKAGAIRSQLRANAYDFHPVISKAELEKGMAPVNLSKNNPRLSLGTINELQAEINRAFHETNAAFLFGGYGEDRNLYSGSVLFNQPEMEARTIHLGVDIWGPAGTAVFAPLGGVVHSFALNDNPGDYGPAIILEHQLDANNFYTLYGHLSTADLGKIRVGQFINRGEHIGHFGLISENGGYPPHLHFQIILDLGTAFGDFPGVCSISEKDGWMENCPDPELMLGLKKWLQNPVQGR